MVKFDVEATYRNVPVHPSDRYLFGMKWRNRYYVYPLACILLPLFSMQSQTWWSGFSCTHIKFPHCSIIWMTLLRLVTQDSPQCVHKLRTALAVCKWLGLPLHPGKCEGLGAVLVILGIKLDLVNQVARLPAEKLLALQGLISSWLPRKWCNRRQLESLIGHLHHAAKVVWPGGTFLRRVIDLLCCFHKKDHLICLNSEFHLDLLWWHQFLSQ